MAWDGVFLCFDVTDRISMYNIISWVRSSHGRICIIFGPPPSPPFGRDKMERERLTDRTGQWHHAVMGGFVSGQPSVPLVHLVGTKTDLRRRRDGRSSLFWAAPEEASWQAKMAGAHRYIECSALTGEGIHLVVDEAAREAATRSVSREGR
ncbi:Ras family [Geosmithia morbida]|uniref:Ras family n=1 Tax=Geosmithia morbida TaxID=1094350 RepID=A0A9P4YR58_9HYPO|nr:Ras family [Geosmithia morbida]KAF4119519.1 Ras family [Geosmithia morbida]